MFEDMVKRLDEQCKVHRRYLLACPSTDCTGCWYIHICNDKKFCGLCVDNLHQAIRNGSQEIYHREYYPVGEKMTKLRKQKMFIEKNLEKGENEVMEERLEGVKKSIDIVQQKLDSVKAKMR